MATTTTTTRPARRPRRRLPAACLAALLLAAGNAGALGLLQAYDAALANDPAYQSAIHDYEGGQENKNIGRSQLLPQLQASYSSSKNRTDITNALGTTHPVYNSRSAVLQLRQPLLNLEVWSRYRQSVAQTDLSSAVFASRKQEMIVRLVSAYLDALLQTEQVRLSQAQRDTYVEQKKVNDRLFERGEGTRTDMLETQARQELAEAQLIEAQDNRQAALATLAALVGQEVAALDELRPEFRLAPSAAAGFEEWKATALASNPEIQAQRYAVEAAHQEVNRNRSGHTPKLDLIGTLNKSSSESINTLNQDSTVRSIGFQVTVPLYSGGYVNATSRQAVAGQEKARSDLQGATDKTLVELRRQYNLVLSSSARIQALDKAVVSGKLLVQATQQSIKGGVRINLDLLNAQQQLYTSERDLAQARYNYLLSNLRMRSAAGVLGADDVREVANYFR
ncbi:MAG: TolC family outer membrane protein [Pseudomonadota bacterium]